MKPTYEELEQFLRDLNQHDSYWWQEACDMEYELTELLERIDSSKRFRSITQTKDTMDTIDRIAVIGIVMLVSVLSTTVAIRVSQGFTCQQMQGATYYDGRCITLMQAEPKNIELKD